MSEHDVLEIGPDGRRIIRLDLEIDEPEPDPPDGECALCGGAVAGWHVKHNPVVLICWPCRSTVSPNNRTFNGVRYAVRAFDVERRLPVFRDASIVLWHLEREIDRQSAITT